MVDFKKIILFTCILIIAIVVLYREDSISKNSSLKKCKLILINSHNKPIVLHTEVAMNDESRQKGLMFRKNLPENNGMLFVFKKEQQLHFWMKNTFIPLSIAYISKNGIINEIHHMQPLDTTVTYPSQYPARYALETNQGWFQKMKITKGNKALINGCISQ